MYVFGYQLFHSDYASTSQSSSKEFRNGSSLITDFSFQNGESAFNSQTLNTLKAGSQDAYTICSTNQAPVTIKYYAAMTTTNSKTDSYYKYWRTLDDFNNNVEPSIVNNITNDTRFTQDGYYQIFIKYNFSNYKKLENGALSQNAQDLNHYQFFSFAINNSEPNISVEDINGAILSNGYTNQNANISWSANTVFDIAPRVRILKHLFTSAQDQWIEVYNDNKKNVANYGITYSNTDGELITIDNSFNGLYQVIISYGPGSNTNVKYRFNIDTQAISGLKTLEVLDLTEQNISGLEEKVNKITYAETSNSIISSAFALDYSDKISGAKITATYDFIPLEQTSTNFDLVNIAKLNAIYSGLQTKTITSLSNALLDISSLNFVSGYGLQSLNSNLPYVKANITRLDNANSSIDILNSLESLKTSAGFYLFTLQDEAGNQTFKAIFVDKSKPSVYKFIDEDNVFTTMVNTENIASRDSIVIWGNNKQIELDSAIAGSLNEFLTKANATESFNFDSNSNLLVNISNVQVSDTSSVISKKYTDEHIVSANHQVFYIKYTEKQQQELDNEKVEDARQEIINKYWNYGEHIHGITVFDQSLNKDLQNINQDFDLYNQVFNTSQNVMLEMNSDNSLLMFYLTDENGNYQRTFDSEVSNYNKLYFEWLQNTGNDYEVSSINYYYFPLTFEQDSPNYPYSATPQVSEAIDLTSVKSSTIVGHGSKVLSASINAQGGGQSLEGMYLIRREYKNSINQVANKSGDYSPRYYLLFIDRNKVVSYTSSLQLLGDKIGFTLGTDAKENYQVEFSGSDFLIDSSTNNLKFTTSKLPIQFLNEIASLNKFDSASLNITDNKTEYVINNENTSYNISKTILNTFALLSPTIEYKQSASEDYTLAKDSDTLSFRNNGFYRVTLKDSTSAKNDSNNFVFTFRVDVTSPRAQVAKYALNGNVYETISYDEEEQNISTNKKRNMLVIWNKPASSSGYDAEIDAQNFKVVVTLESGTKITYTVNNGLLYINGAVSSTNLTVHDISTDALKAQSMFENPTWDYYIDFADILELLPSEYASQSARFEITLQYIGNESDYSALSSETPNKFFYTIKNVVFDFKKPEYNLNRLLSTDAYLNNYYKSSLKDTSLFDIFNDLSSEINYENYAFTVDKNFTLDYTTVTPNSIWTEKNMDTYKMFIRKYDKYNGDGRENQQSLTPDDPRCDENIYTATRLKFDENYRINGNKVYVDISDYYWDNGEHKDYTLEYIISDKFNNAYNCYYEIIEVDYAGNYRIYTLFVKEDMQSSSSYSNANFAQAENATSTVTNKTLAFTNLERYTVGTNKQISLIDASNIDSIISNNNLYPYSKLYSCILSLQGITDEDGNTIKQYITASVEDVNNHTLSSLTLAPNGNVSQFISELNSLYSEYNKQNGNIYYITFVTSLGEILKVEHRKPNETYPAYTITTGDTGFTISFTVNSNDLNSSAYFTSFTAYRADKGVMEATPLSVDSNGKTIVTNIEEYLTINGLSSATFSYTFKMQGNTGSEYYLLLGDNFDRELKIRQVVGVEDNTDKIDFMQDASHLVDIEAYDEQDITSSIDITYTNGYANLKFQNVLYTVDIYQMKLEKIGERYVVKQVGDDKLEINEDLYSKDINGIWTYPLITERTANDTIYKVVFTSTVGQEVHYVGYHNTIDNVYIIKPADNQTGNLKILVNDQDVNTFDREVYISIESDESLFPTLVTGTRTYLDTNGNVVTEPLGQISNNQTLSSLGSYTFVVENTLGTTITFIVKLEEKISNNYWVTHYIGGVDNGTLVPVSQDRSNQYDYGSINNPIKYFTIYEFEVKTDTANNYVFELLQQEDIRYNNAVVGSISAYKIYQRIVSEDEVIENNVVYITVTKVVANNNFVRSYDNMILINDSPKTASSVTITQDEDNKTKTATIKLDKTYNLVEGNDIIMTVTYNSQFLREINLSKVTDPAELTFEDSGIYQFSFRDIAGNKQVFDKNSSYFQMALINDVIFTINDQPSVNNSVFNGKVVLALQNLDKFSGNISVISKLNGKQIAVKSVNRTYTYTDYGFYEITLSGIVKKDSDEAQTNITTVFKFRIINTNEAMATFEYVGLNNYEITKIERLVSGQDTQSIDITDDIKTQLNVTSLNTLALSSLENGLGGAGYYRITVTAKYSENKPEQSFTFDVWLNNDFDVLIKSSIQFGGSSTKPISLTLNKQQIYNKVGECKIYLNDTEWLVINEETASENLTEIYTIEKAGTYNVRLVTNSGNTLESFMLTKKEPLNAVAIIVIILSIVIVGVVVFIFIKLRKNMKVK